MDKQHLLHNKSSIKLNVKLGDDWGTIHLCSVYGCYEHECDFDITGVDIAEFYCPHCFHILTTKEKCNECHAPIVDFLLDIGGKVSICSRKGCRKHYVAFEDIGTMLKKFYDEYGF